RARPSEDVARGGRPGNSNSPGLARPTIDWHTSTADDFSDATHVATEGLGPIARAAQGPQGLHLHSTLAFTVQGTPLGFLDVQCWARKAEEFGKKAKRHSVPIEQKESYKWLKSYRALAAVQARQPKTTLVSVGDREADLYELFAEAATHPAGPK